MDELLRRRLVGAAVLLGGAWLVASLLPAPGPDSGHSAGHVVTYDLRTGQPVDLPPLARNLQRPALPPPDESAPEPETSPAIATAPAASAPAPTATQAPSPAPAPESPSPVRPAPKAPAKEAAKEPPKEQASAKPGPGTLAHPVLKVDESFGEKAPASAWYVQIGSFASEANAKKVMKQLLDERLPALTQMVPQDKKLWYRVRVGPYKSESSVQTALATIKQKGFKTAKVIKPETSPAPARN